MAPKTTETRTSTSSPLQIEWLRGEPPIDRVGLTFAPGKKGPAKTNPYAWDRDLETDLDVLVAAGTNTLVCLLEDEELAPNGLVDLLPGVAKRGIEVLRLPIPDTKIPANLESVDALVDQLEQRLGDGKRVVIHCLGGLGRTGTIAGCYLVRQGIDTPEALARLTEARGPKCPENSTQRGFIARYAEHARGAK